MKQSIFTKEQNNYSTTILVMFMKDGFDGKKMQGKSEGAMRMCSFRASKRSPTSWVWPITPVSHLWSLEPLDHVGIRLAIKGIKE